MTRIKIELPDHFSFVTEIPIRITDLNYGGHVGNDTILSIIHEARVRFLRYHHYSELEMGGVSLIMGDAGIEFKSEIFYGDVIRAHVTAGSFTRVAFDLFYRLEKETAGKTILVAVAKTGMVCYDYKQKKIVAVPEEVKARLGD